MKSTHSKICVRHKIKDWSPTELKKIPKPFFKIKLMTWYCHLLWFILAQIEKNNTSYKSVNLTGCWIHFCIQLVVFFLNSCDWQQRLCKSTLISMLLASWRAYQSNKHNYLYHYWEENTQTLLLNRCWLILVFPPSNQFSPPIKYHPHKCSSNSVLEFMTLILGPVAFPFC